MIIIYEDTSLIRTPSPRSENFPYMYVEWNLSYLRNEDSSLIRSSFLSPTPFQLGHLQNDGAHWCGQVQFAQQRFTDKTATTTQRTVRYNDYAVFKHSYSMHHKKFQFYERPLHHHHVLAIKIRRVFCCKESGETRWQSVHTGVWPHPPSLTNTYEVITVYCNVLYTYIL
jgi:hypothetical protein